MSCKKSVGPADFRTAGQGNNLMKTRQFYHERMPCPHIF
ncbi:hypothetical protein BAZSYMA_ACONTIG20046_0 [Bathymodiolus azoricus thioautotrophic gill symbiont]|uniref:Uncharacterized protein n=1 Tax=Bathymodiolus azoricus thioautotrophic gill symbiont TaxID=235205 RepID=A0A1H6JG67_9GAMM|nr:hypothetical protein BAZSYMA_ACONTIG20046_0 [Bathymodiolus azoricus thioautotrophic gill symbiont]